MTRRDIIDRFQGMMDSYNRVYWNDTRATDLLNAVKDRLAQEFTVNRTEQYYTFNSVEGQQNYQVPSTYVAHRHMYFDSGYNRVLKMVDGPESIYGPVSDQTIEGVPGICYIWGVSGRRELTFYPTFNADAIEIQWWFYGWPPDVAVDNDEPHLPLEWHPSIVEIMVAEQQSADKIITVGDKFLIWDTNVRRLKRLDVTKQLTSVGGQSGTMESHFPAIPGSGSPIPFNIEFPGGSVEPV